jgi:hypothetical protein
VEVGDEEAAAAVERDPFSIDEARRAAAEPILTYLGQD